MMIYMYTRKYIHIYIYCNFLLYIEMKINPI